MLKFYYNGIKASDKEGLQKAYFWFGHYADGTKKVTICARDYKRFSKEIRDNFVVKNESDIMTDYFEEDSIEIDNKHPFAKQVVNSIILNIKKSKYTAENIKNEQIREVMEWLNQ